MAQPGEALDRYDLASRGDTVREDLSDIIHDISPTETPFQANIGRGTAESDKTEWQIDQLADANQDNAHVDGDDFDGDPLTDPARLGTYCQISRKDIVVTRRADKVNKAGMRSALSYFVAKAGRELKRDVEARLLCDQAPVQGSSTVPSETGGADVWLTTSTLNGALGSDPGLTNGIPTDRTLGSPQALSESALLDLLRSVFEAGGNPTMMMLTPELKVKYSNYMFTANARIATQYQDHGANPRSGLTAVGAVDVWVTDFGVQEVVPNRFLPESAADTSTVYLIDPEYWEVAYLDGYMVETIAKSGDSEKRMLLVDYALCSKNEAASGAHRDTNETTDMVA